MYCNYKALGPPEYPSRNVYVSDQRGAHLSSISRFGAGPDNSSTYSYSVLPLASWLDPL